MIHVLPNGDLDRPSSDSMSAIATIAPTQNATASATHLLWVGHWIEATRVHVLGEPGWRFKNGHDAVAWLKQ